MAVPFSNYVLWWDVLLNILPSLAQIGFLIHFPYICILFSPSPHFTSISTFNFFLSYFLLLFSNPPLLLLLLLCFLLSHIGSFFCPTCTTQTPLLPSFFTLRQNRDSTLPSQFLCYLFVHFFSLLISFSCSFSLSLTLHYYVPCVSQLCIW
jgi:hypothetical protein